MDPEGDELIVNFRVKSSESQITSSQLGSNDFIKTIAEAGNIIKHSINLTKLKSINKDFVNFEDLILSIDPNTFEKIPTDLSSDIKYGVPLEIWTSTRVLNDTNNIFGIEESPVSKFGYQ